MKQYLCHERKHLIIIEKNIFLVFYFNVLLQHYKNNVTNCYARKSFVMAAIACFVISK